MKYEMCQYDEEMDIISSSSFYRDSQNNSQINASLSSISNIKQGNSNNNNNNWSDINLGGSLSSFQSINQYRKNEQLNTDEKFVFELTKQYVLNECKMMQVQTKDLKMKNMIRKGDLGGVYGVRYREEYYIAKVVTFISQRQLDQFITFQTTIPHTLQLLQILAYALSTNHQGAINLYLISEIKRSNLANSMFNNEIIRIEQKIRIIDQLLDCVASLHNKNIYHSNIKDTNILLDMHCNISLSDLAVTRVFKDYDFGENSFKQPYAAPEQVLETEPVIGKYNDMWAIGIIALQLLTNVPSFTPQLITSLNLYAKVDFKLNIFQTSPVIEVHKLENSMASFIESLLRFEPKKRLNIQQAINSFKEIKQAFESLKKQKS